MKVFIHFSSQSMLRTVARSFLLATVLLLSSGWALAQTITGTVVDETGLGLPGASIIIEGTTTGTVTDIDGTYSITATNGDVLLFSFTGYRTTRVEVSGQSTIDVALDPDVAVLEQVVVTGYQSQRKGDITGAVAVLDTDELTGIAATSVNQQLEGRATGVVTSTSGQAGGGTNIRIRGISSFTSNDPLIVVDGVPQLNNFLNNINPNDIESLQILKDASAASIYGTRAANGVIIITTKKGKSGRPRITYDAYYGIQDHERGFDDILIQSTDDYANLFWNTYANVGALPPSDVYGTGSSPVIPEYYFPGNQVAVNEADYSYPDNLIMRSNRQGTNWWDEVFDPAPITDHTLAISGGNDAGTYRISANYLDQQGTMITTYFKRYALRANSQWKVGKVTFGESLNISRVETVGVPGGLQNEQGALMQIVKAQPIIPVYDVSGIHFAGGKTNGLSNGSNPVGVMLNNKDDVGEYDAIIGSAFGEIELIDGLRFKSNFGVNYSVGGALDWTFPTHENSEPSTVTSFAENLNRSFNWVWTNTLSYNRTFNERHAFNAILGYESLKERFRQINGSLAGFTFIGTDTRYLNGALANPDTRQVGSSGREHTLLSVFGKVDYTLDNKYLLSATLRRDGSSRFGADNRYAVFPSASLGWRVSAEPFMENISWLSDLKLRVGYGTVGNENIGDYRSSPQYGGGVDRTFYAIGGGGLATGYTALNQADPGIGWEEKETANIGLDVSILDDKFNLVLDIYQSTVNDLLFNPELPWSAGLAGPPFVNIGTMENNGWDLALGWRPNVGALKFDISANLSHYTNTIVNIDGEANEFVPRGAPEVRTAIGNYNINRLGGPIGSFNGLTWGGIWQSQDEINAANAIDGDPSTEFQANAAPGRFRWVDIDSFDPETGERTGMPDGKIDDADLSVIGSPHPDLTAGLNLGVTYKNFDLTAFFFGSFGNDILNTTKQFTIFRQFNSNADARVLTDAWTPGNTDTDIPLLDINDAESRRLSSFYVEDGSYVRLKQLQLGYTLPASFGGNVISNLRLYVQAQNLFTITNYSGLDPALSSFDVSGQDADDLYMGIDYGNYPTTRIIMFGVSAGF